MGGTRRRGPAERAVVVEAQGQGREEHCDRWRGHRGHARRARVAAGRAFKGAGAVVAAVRRREDGQRRRRRVVRRERAGRGAVRHGEGRTRREPRLLAVQNSRHAGLPQLGRRSAASRDAGELQATLDGATPSSPEHALRPRLRRGAHRGREARVRREPKRASPRRDGRLQRRERRSVVLRHGRRGQPRRRLDPRRRALLRQLHRLHLPRLERRPLRNRPRPRRHQTRRRRLLISKAPPLFFHRRLWCYHDGRRPPRPRHHRRQAPQSLRRPLRQRPLPRRRHPPLQNKARCCRRHRRLPLHASVTPAVLSVGHAAAFYESRTDEDNVVVLVSYYY
mmetsp:Transcript_21711/g.66901  ORF Transcript_21711/g.66901 Transcript_21711/m.66901 type:complete len:336 (-) Transcript_21711:22-1029(-)